MILSCCGAEQRWFKQTPLSAFKVSIIFPWCRVRAVSLKRGYPREESDTINRQRSAFTGRASTAAREWGMSGGEGRRGKRLRDIKKKEEQFTTDILDMLIFDADHSCQQEKCELKHSKQFPEHLFSYDIYHPYRTSPLTLVKLGHPFVCGRLSRAHRKIEDGERLEEKTGPER